MQPFTFVIPHDLAEAVAAAKQPNAQLKAAGIDLIDRMKEGIASPAEVVNLLPLAKELAGIASDNGGVRLGALTTLTALAEADLLQDRMFLAIQQAAATAASPQIRNRATLAGNLLQQTRCWYLRSAAFGCLHGGKGPTCLAMSGENRYHAVMGWSDCVRVHPSSLAPALLALDAEFSVQSGDKLERRKLSELFPKDPKAQAPEHTLAPGDIIVALHVPAQAPGTRSAYSESREKLAYDWATTACAVKLTLDGGVIKAANIVLGAVAPVPVPRPGAAKLLLGKAPSDELFQQAAEAAFAGATPVSQTAYKIPVGKAIVREALLAAAR